MVSNTAEMEWFETMTLFVPICGAVALVLLVFIAIKLLKSNNSLDDGSLVSKIRPNKNYGFTILSSNGGPGHHPPGVHNAAALKVSSNGYHKCVQSKMLPSDVYRPTTYVFAVPTAAAVSATADKNAAAAAAATAANMNNHRRPIDLTKHNPIAAVNCHYEETLSAHHNHAPGRYGAPVDDDDAMVINNSKNHNGNNSNPPTTVANNVPATPWGRQNL